MKAHPRWSLGVCDPDTCAAFMGKDPFPAVFVLHLNRLSAEELRGNLYAAAKKPVRTVIGGQVCILKVRAFESFGEDAFEVSIDPAPKLDPSIAPSFTAKQGQYRVRITLRAMLPVCPCV
jgi:hypothetical protein